MDNNNSLPYGAISSRNDNIPLHQIHFEPTGPVSASNETQSFNPILMARNVNVHLQHQAGAPGHISSAIHLPTRHLNPSTRNNPYRIPPIHYNTNMSQEQNMASSSSPLRDSDNSLIIDNNISHGDNNGLNFSHQLTDTRTVDVFSSRYFQPPWSAGGVLAHNENTRVDGSRGVTAHLPIIREETTPGILNTSFGCINSKKPTGLKRRVSRDDESDDGLLRRASKLLLTEEKMAAKMHNLRISNDHCYHVNGPLPQLNVPVCGTNGIVSDVMSPVTKSDDDKDNDEHKEDDNNNMESGEPTMFVLAPGIKESLSKNNNQLLPQSIIDQMSKPCLAVIPWKPRDDILTKLSLHINQNKTDDEKTAQKKSKFFENKSDLRHQPTGFITSTIHTEAMDDVIEPFDYEEDDMDL